MPGAPREAPLTRTDKAGGLESGRVRFYLTSDLRRALRPILSVAFHARRSGFSRQRAFI